MATPLSMNELQALDRKVASVVDELAEVARLLRTRYGDQEPVAADASSAYDQFSRVANQIHRQAVASRAEAQPKDQSRIA